MENKNTSRVVIGVLVVLVLLLGGYIAVSGGKSAATANGASGSSRAAHGDLSGAVRQAGDPHRPQQKRHPAGLGRLYHPRKDQKRSRRGSSSITPPRTFGTRTG